MGLTVLLTTASAGAGADARLEYCLLQIEPVIYGP